MAEKLTKHALEESLKKLLLEKPLNKITIQDITDDCGISRMTFYYHFKDIYDLVEWCCKENTERAIAGNLDYENWQKGLTGILRAIIENKDLIINIYRAVGLGRVEAFVEPQVHALIRAIADTYDGKGEGLAEEDKDFIIDFYQFALEGVIMKWIRNDMEEEPERLTQRLAALVEGSLERGIERIKAMRAE